ncbi:hypothetical protein CPAV1605_650 [seawater metagenome]|uniref:Prolyl 4-hydroxylase alpha subunit Fe(2+) 2OG dioxygenase domain-containing protein n=1 Tax=seawater metagenome TaxID=1561972 RepID=A0A5E8CLI9_9ZZZZ
MKLSINIIFTILCIILFIALLKKDIFGSTTWRYRIFDLNSKKKITKIANDIWVVDNFYLRPDLIIEFYKNRFYNQRKALYSTKYYNPELIKFKELIEFLESLILKQISYSQWNDHVFTNSNGFFQYILKDNQVSLHTDTATNYGIVVYLDKNPILNKGTSFYKHKKSGDEIRNIKKEYEVWEEGENPQFDKWQKIYSVNNYFNRAVIFNSQRFHCSDGGYGDNKYNSRFFQTYFFNTI